MSNDDTALLVIDVQAGNFEDSASVYGGGDLFARISRLVAHARAAGMPVVYVQHKGATEERLRRSLQNVLIALAEAFFRRRNRFCYECDTF